MNLTDAREIIECLPVGRTLFHYFKDRYALFILGEAAGRGRRVAELKGSRFGRLLQKPIAKKLAASVPDGVLTRQACESAWPAMPETYLLTLGTWGCKKHWRYEQVSRPGVNLVLHMNFTAKHNRQYRKVMKTEDYEWFGSRIHPAAPEGYLTMAWSRLDVDLVRGEVLIEEIQNDWLRDARWLRQHLISLKTPRCRKAYILENFGETHELSRIERYLEHLLAIQSPLWDEAMLTATIEFVHRVLGISRIFYHSFESGMRLKGIDPEWGPPRSLYSDLPRRFCFSLGDERPSFFEELRCRRSKAVLRDPDSRWFMMELKE